MAASEPASSYKVKERLKSRRGWTAFGTSAEYVGAIRNGFIRAPDVARALKRSAVTARKARNASSWKANSRGATLPDRKQAHKKGNKTALIGSR